MDLYDFHTIPSGIGGGVTVDVNCCYRSDFNLYKNWYNIYGPITDFWQYMFLNVPATNGSYQNMFDSLWEDNISIKVIHAIDYDFDVLDFRNLLGSYYFPQNIIFNISIPLNFNGDKERTLMINLHTESTSYDLASIYFKIGNINTGYYLTYDANNEISMSLSSVQYIYIDLGKIIIKDNTFTNLIILSDLIPVNTTENIYFTARIRASTTTYMSIFKQNMDWMNGGNTHINIYLDLLWEQNGNDKLYLCMESNSGVGKNKHTIFDDTYINYDNDAYVNLYVKKNEYYMNIDLETNLDLLKQHFRQLTVQWY